jgi:hypothetical protein
MVRVAVIVDVQDLAYTVLAALVAATAVTIAISLAIRGAARYADLQQQGRIVASYGSLALAGISAVVALAMVALGIFVMVSK